MRSLALLNESSLVGKPEWAAMLRYHAELHGKSLYEAKGAFPYDWQSIGTGYCRGAAFGHWDVIHEILDHIPVDPEFACTQIINNLYHQMPNGFLPGSIWMKSGTPDFSDKFGHPPLWIYAIDQYHACHSAKELVIAVLPNLLRQIGWFEQNRSADSEGFYYLDILTHDWESGVDEGVRFNRVQTGKKACIDATSHVYAMYDAASRWLELAGQNGDAYRAKATRLADFIVNGLYSAESGFFYDSWAVNDPENRVRTFDGFWPLVCGIATAEQAAELIDNNLLNETRFFTEHPIPTVSLGEPCFEQRMWRGPAWNSMTYWVAKGCVRYGRQDAAVRILEKALDMTAVQFEATSTIWEFYHSTGGDPHTVQRKPWSKPNMPSRDYLGHNPLFAMARLYVECGGLKTQKQSAACAL
jgi:putative isomerase